MTAAAALPPGSSPVDAQAAAGPGLMLAAIRADQETGDIARIFTALRVAAGYDLIPLLYRVLAADPAALDWSWRVLEPAFRQGLVASAARAAGASLAGRRFAHLPPPARTVLGLADTDIAEAAAVVAGFNHANPLNLAVLLLLDQALREGAVAGAPDASAALSIAATLPLPSVSAGAAAGTPHRLPLEVAALPPDQAALIRYLSTRGGREAFVVAPTLWRCLAHWPPLLALSAVILEPLYAGETVEHATGAIRGSVLNALRSRPGSDSLRRGIVAPAAAQADHVRCIVGVFSSKIPEMIFTGHVLHQLMAED